MSKFFVKAWEEAVTIPTYAVGEPDKNPMFLEKRVYQGSSGVVYPFAVTDKVYDTKEDKIYNALFLENPYLKIMILPELGGRIQMAYDKTNDYHFIYYNQVIKPALVGLTGPWISGGIEFNWPQHHRPGTFEPVDYTIESNADGSMTVWVGEIEKMFHTKGMVGFTLYPDKAYLEIKGKLYNRTPLPQTFLWWSNPAVAVNENYQSIFPPDVNAVYDHGRRDVSAFPIATGTYYKVDYSPGTDISWYKNIPVPTSYMAVNSAFNFIGGYDHGRNAGMLHVADHQISPGKKQWTWGHSDFGQAWERQLTDEDGPYCEIMTGMFTDNQPDFGWIMPNEERNFLQYFMPYKNVGYVKNATIDGCVNLEINGDSATIQVYVTAEEKNISVRLSYNETFLFEDKVDLSPEKAYKNEIHIPENCNETGLKVVVTDSTGKVIVGYQPLNPKKDDVPEPAKSIPDPALIPDNEGLYLAGLHLEQYRHATRSPIAYYEEALRRNPSDIRNNNALGLWYLRHGQFKKAEKYFETAITSLTKYNNNPYEGEAFYNLGLACFYQKNIDRAYDCFYKSTWNAAWQDKAFLFLARIEAQRGNFAKALQHAEQSVAKNYHGAQARNLKIVLLRKLKQLNQAKEFAIESLTIDPLNFAAANERILIMNELGDPGAEVCLTKLTTEMRNDGHTYVEVAIDYACSGFYPEAIELLERIVDKTSDIFTKYYLSYFNLCADNREKAQEYASKAFEVPVGHIFCNRLEDIDMLQSVIKINPNDYKAWYYLGNLWYDKRQYSEAIDAWEKSKTIFNEFATVWRNLGIAYYNRAGDESRALSYYEKALKLNPDDSRVLYELDQLRKRANQTPSERLSFLQQFFPLVQNRDDLYIEYITLLNITGRHSEAQDLLESRNFHPWEGGEGKVSQQHILTHVELAKSALTRGDTGKAIALLEQARIYPHNLGEGKLFGAQENDIFYWLGCCYEKTGFETIATDHWEKASAGKAEVGQALFYNDQQPDKIFYQGLAHNKLGNNEEATQRFDQLISYGEQHLDDEVKIDFFAVSLPDLSIFDDDLNKRNKIHCHYLMGLGFLGLGKGRDASMHFETVLKMDSAHQGAITHQKMLSLDSFAA